MELGERRVDVLLAELVAMELAREVGLVRRHVEVTVAAKVEEDDALFALFLGFVRLANRRRHAVIRFRRRDDSLGASEEHARFEALDLVDRLGVDQLVVKELADERARAVVAQAAGVDLGRHEVVTQGVHGNQRSHPDGVAEIVAKDAARQLRARRRLGGQAADFLTLREVHPKERKAEPREV